MERSTLKSLTYILLAVFALAAFAAEASANPTLKWRYTTGARAHLSPLAHDVTGDGIMEIFATGAGRITALNGRTGSRLWTYANSNIMDHSPIEIADLNNDGQFEVVVAAGSETIALRARDGSVMWRTRTESQNKFLMVLDTDGTKRPYVYIASGNFSGGENGPGRIRKLNGATGQVLLEKFVWYPCYGGFSAADADGDGRIEVYMTDRREDYESTSTYKGLGKGTQAYDAETLELLWYEPAITTSSHLAAVVDVNSDGRLDVVSLPQGVDNGGIFVNDGGNGRRIPGKYAGNLGLPTHSPFSIHDIDRDGRLELITARDKSNAYVWDMGTWSLDAILPHNYAEPPMMGNVMGDSRLEVIGADGPVRIYDGQSFELLRTIWDAGMIAGTIVQDIDNDGRNELVGISHATGTVSAYDTTAAAPSPRARTTNHYYSERRLGAAVFVPKPGRNAPVIRKVSPLDNSDNVPMSPVLRAEVIDYQYDRMNIEIQTNVSGSWRTVATFSNVGTGTYSYNTGTSMNQWDKEYYWRVRAVDVSGSNTVVTKTFKFKRTGSKIADTSFDANGDSNALRTNGAGQDWYESRNHINTILTLDQTNVGGNSGKKAKFTTNAAANAYLTQQFSSPQRGFFTVEWDVYIDSVADNSLFPDRTAFMIIGDDSVSGRGPNAADGERFVYLAFHQQDRVSTLIDLVVLDRDDPFNSINRLASNLRTDRWYNVKVHINLYTDTYDVYLNDVFKGTVTSRRAKSALTHISFAHWSPEGMGTFYIDNVRSPAN